ncbi:TPA: hypothetical protein ACH3X1_007478 [Trebouxia sp. C0004]
MQGLLFQTATSSELTMVRSAFRLGKWRQDQGKPRAVLVGADFCGYQAYSLPGLQTPQRSEDQAARATAPPPPRQQQAQEPRVTVAMDSSALLHQHGISLDQLSDTSSVVAQAAQATLLILIT